MKDVEIGGGATVLDEAEREHGFDDLNSLIETLNRLDERGLIVSLGAFAEEALGELLRAFLLNNVSARPLTTGFNAPLGSFSARIKGCHALGLITDEQFSDLEHLRKLRNIFAHTWKELSFEEPNISAHITALSFPTSGDRFPENPREKATQSLSFLLVELGIRADQTARLGQGAKLIGSRLVTGYSGSPAEQRQKLADERATLERESLNATGERLRHLQAGRRRCDILEGILKEN